MSEHVTIDDYLKPDIESRVNHFYKKFMEWLDNGNFQVNSDVDSKFDFILPNEYLRKIIGINYAIGVTPTDEEYDDIIFLGQTNYEDKVIDKYLNMLTWT